MKNYKKYVLVALCLCVSLLLNGVYVKGYADSSPSDVKIGSYVTFGTYPQEKSGKDKTPVEWLVLDIDGDNALLISRYCLDAQRYNYSMEYVSWEDCSLRLWLNDTFLNTAFTDEEQSSILVTDVDNSKKQSDILSKERSKSLYPNKLVNGNNTKDKIFLLSCAEVTEYFGITTEYDYYKSPQAHAEVTKYAIAQDALSVSAEGKKLGLWWLRSPGAAYNAAASVFCGAQIIGTSSVLLTTYSVRPAMWVNIDSEVFRSEN